MKKTRNIMRSATLLLAVLLLVGALSLSSAAAGTSNGYIIPTDASLKSQRSSYSFTGNSGTLYFMLFSKGKTDAYFAVEIYSKSDYSGEPVTTCTSEYGESGSKSLPIVWKFKSTPSGKYYGKCYTYISGSNSNKPIDGTEVKFTVNINRMGNQTVMLSKISNAVGGIYIEWAGVNTAEKYMIYRKASGDKSWTKIATVNSSSKSYKDTSVKSNKVYTYTVKAADAKYTSKYDSAGLTLRYIATPTSLSAAASGNYGNAKLSWKAVSGAEGYKIYRKGGTLSEEAAGWKCIATVSSKYTSYTDKAATGTDWRYTYTVIAYKGNVGSSYDHTGVEFNYLKHPVLKKLSTSLSGITLTWSDTNKRTDDYKSYSYAVYRKASGDKSWTLLGKTKSKTFTDTKPVSGKKYFYTVKSICDTNYSAYDKTGISTYFLAPPTLSKVTLLSSGQTKVSWKAVTGAKGYYVFRKAGSGSWEKIATVSGAKTVSYADSFKKTSGVKYTYTVKAFNGTYQSSHDTKGISSVYLSTPTFTLTLDTYSSTDGILVKWSKVTGAKGYNVYRKAPGATTWSLLAKGITTLTYFDSSVESGKEYTYTVKALNGNDASLYTSQKYLFLSKPILTDAVITETGVKITWSKVPGAETYYVFRKAPGGQFTAIGSYSLNEYTDESAEALKEPFIYTVIATKGNYKSNYDDNGVKNYVAVSKLKAVVTNPTVSTDASIAVTWTGDAEAVTYNVYRIENDGEAVLVKTLNATDELKFIDSEVKQGATYVYTVEPVAANKINIKTSCDKATVKFIPLPIAEFTVTTVREAATEKASITLNWNPVEFAQGYEIYRKTGADGEWAKIADAEASDEPMSYLDETAATDTEYYYSVKAVAFDRDSEFDSVGIKAVALSAVKSVNDISVTLIDDTESEGEKSAFITWSQVENAQYYKVMRKAAGAAEWELVDTRLVVDDSASYSATDDTILKDVEYTYTVVAFAYDRQSFINEDGVTLLWADLAE